MKSTAFDKLIFNGLLELKQDRSFQVVDQSLFEHVDSAPSLNTHSMHTTGMLRLVNSESHQDNLHYLSKTPTLLSIYIVPGGFVFVDNLP